jgi:hypothetical protein
VRSIVVSLGALAMVVPAPAPASARTGELSVSSAELDSYSAASQIVTVPGLSEVTITVPWERRLPR